MLRDCAPITRSGMLTPINPVERAEPFDHPDWLFDRFRAASDTVSGRLISRDGNRMQRFGEMFDLLPRGHVFDGELVALDDAVRPLFDELLFWRRRPTYLALELLIADRVDPLPLREPLDDPSLFQLTVAVFQPQSPDMGCRCRLADS